MKNKKIIIIFIFLFSLLVLFLPVALGVYYNLDQIYNISKYEEACEEFNTLNDDILYDENSKNNFLERSDGVFGVLSIKEMNFKQPIYYQDFNTSSKNRFLLGDVIDGCILIYANNQHFAENGINRLIDVDRNCEIIFDIFGKRKKFVVDNTKIISGFNEEAYLKNKKKKLNILIGTPFGINSHKYLIKARYLHDEKKEKLDNFSEFMFNEYLISISICVIILVLMIFIILLIKLISYIKTNNKTIKIKYRPKIYNFEYK